MSDQDAAHEETQQTQEQVRRPAAHESSAAPAFDGGPMAAVERLASNVGNRNFSEMVSRMSDGDGIMSGGLVHPDVEAAIGAARGGGGPLDQNLQARLSEGLGHDMSQVRVHTDDQAASLTRAVSARAFTVGNDIFFAPGEYKPGSSEGNELITHEATHVVQQAGAPSNGPLTVSTPGDTFEREADAVARDLTV